MANEAGLELPIGLTEQKFMQQLARIEARSIKAAKRSEDAFKQSNASSARSFNQLEQSSVRALSRMTTALTSLAGVFGAREIGKMADAWTDYSARVGLAIGDMEAAAPVMERLYQMAQRTYTEFDTTAEGFLSFSTSLREVGMSTNESLRFVEAFNNAMVVSGAKAERAASVQNNLSKAMASGTLRGQELNAVIQTGGRMAELLAEHFGTTVGGLRDVGKEGRITGAVIQDVLTRNYQILMDEAESMPATISDGFMRIRNAALRFVGTLDQVSGASSKVAEALVWVSDNFEGMAVAGLTATGMIMSKYVPALARATAAQVAMIATNPFLLAVAAISAAAGALVMFGDEIKIIEDDAAGLNDYLLSAFDGIKVMAGEAAEYTINAFHSLTSYIVDAFEGVGVEWDEVTSFIYNSINKIIGFQMALHKTAVAVFTGLPAAIADGVVSAINYMIEKVSQGLNFVIDRVNDLRSAISGWTIAGVEITGAFEPINHVSFDGLVNNFEGAIGDMGDALADARSAIGEDWLGAGADAASGFFEGWRDAANDKAAARDAARSTRDAALAGILDASPGVVPGSSGEGSSGKGKKGRKGRAESPFFESVEQDLRNLEREIELVGKSTREVATARATWAMLDEAKKRGIPVNETLFKQIEAQADEVGRLTNELERAEIAQQQFDRAVDGIADAFSGALVAGESLREGLGQVFKQIASDILNSGIRNALTSVFGGSGLNLFGFLGGGDKLSGALRGAGLSPSFAGGGFTGHGPRSGGIDGHGGFHAILHPNETVIDHARGQQVGGNISFAPNISIAPGVTQEELAMTFAQARQEYERNFLPMLRKNMPGFNERYS